MPFAISRFFVKFSRFFVEISPKSTNFDEKSSKNDENSRNFDEMDTILVHFHRNGHEMDKILVHFHGSGQKMDKKWTREKWTETKKKLVIFLFFSHRQMADEGTRVPKAPFAGPEAQPAGGRGVHAGRAPEPRGKEHSCVPFR